MDPAGSGFLLKPPFLIDRLAQQWPADSPGAKGMVDALFSINVSLTKPLSQEDEGLCYFVKYLAEWHMHCICLSVHIDFYVFNPWCIKVAKLLPDKPRQNPWGTKKN